ncbi:hypothetical protein BC830DRAFT_1127664 [Chytriomyces sp. MP71]|nr:hypothetical protein BC830DRAFT_1127664 [Chytriomyces sp. MP71]
MDSAATAKPPTGASSTAAPSNRKTLLSPASAQHLQMGSFGRIVVIRRNGEDGCAFPLNIAKVTFGRDKNCTIRVKFEEVSRFHCIITVDSTSNQIYITDTSSNGTLLNGVDIGNGVKVRLNNGDVFTIQTRLFRFEYPRAEKVQEFIKAHPNTNTYTPRAILLHAEKSTMAMTPTPVASSVLPAPQTAIRKHSVLAEPAATTASAAKQEGSTPKRRKVTEDSDNVTEMSSTFVTDKMSMSKVACVAESQECVPSSTTKEPAVDSLVSLVKSPSARIPNSVSRQRLPSGTPLRVSIAATDVLDASNPVPAASPVPPVMVRTQTPVTADLHAITQANPGCSFAIGLTKERESTPEADVPDSPPNAPSPTPSQAHHPAVIQDPHNPFQVTNPDPTIQTTSAVRVPSSPTPRITTPRPIKPPTRGSSPLGARSAPTRSPRYLFPTAASLARSVSSARRRGSMSLIDFDWPVRAAKAPPSLTRSTPAFEGAGNAPEATTSGGEEIRTESSDDDEQCEDEIEVKPRAVEVVNEVVQDGATTVTDLPVVPTPQEYNKEMTPEKDSEEELEVMEPGSRTPSTLPESQSMEGSGKKKVTFGPALSPEIFRKDCPAATPLKRGASGRPFGTPGSSLKSVLRRTIHVIEPHKAPVSNMTPLPAALARGVNLTKLGNFRTPIVPGAGSGSIRFAGPNTTGKIPFGGGGGAAAAGKVSSSPVKNLRETFKFVAPANGLRGFYGGAAAAAPAAEESMKEMPPATAGVVDVVPATPEAMFGDAPTSPRRSSGRRASFKAIVAGGSVVKGTPPWARSEIGNSSSGYPLADRELEGCEEIHRRDAVNIIEFVDMVELKTGGNVESMQAETVAANFDCVNTIISNTGATFSEAEGVEAVSSRNKEEKVIFDESETEVDQAEVSLVDVDEEAGAKRQAFAADEILDEDLIMGANEDEGDSQDEGVCMMEGATDEFVQGESPTLSSDWDVSNANHQSIQESKGCCDVPLGAADDCVLDIFDATAMHSAVDSELSCGSQSENITEAPDGLCEDEDGAGASGAVQSTRPSDIFVKSTEIVPVKLLHADDGELTDSDIQDVASANSSTAHEESSESAQLNVVESTFRQNPSADIESDPQICIVEAPFDLGCIDYSEVLLNQVTTEAASGSQDSQIGGEEDTVPNLTLLAVIRVPSSSQDVVEANLECGVGNEAASNSAALDENVTATVDAPFEAEKQSASDSPELLKPDNDENRSNFTTAGVSSPKVGLIDKVLDVEDPESAVSSVPSGLISSPSPALLGSTAEDELLVGCLDKSRIAVDGRISLAWSTSCETSGSNARLLDRGSMLTYVKDVAADKEAQFMDTDVVNASEAQFEIRKSLEADSEVSTSVCETKAEIFDTVKDQEAHGSENSKMTPMPASPSQDNSSSQGNEQQLPTMIAVKSKSGKKAKSVAKAPKRSGRKREVAEEFEPAAEVVHIDEAEITSARAFAKSDNGLYSLDLEPGIGVETAMESEKDLSNRGDIPSLDEVESHVDLNIEEMTVLPQLTAYLEVENAMEVDSDLSDSTNLHVATCADSADNERVEDLPDPDTVMDIGEGRLEVNYVAPDPAEVKELPVVADAVKKTRGKVLKPKLDFPPVKFYPISSAIAEDDVTPSDVSEPLTEKRRAGKVIRRKADDSIVAAEESESLDCQEQDLSPIKPANKRARKTKLHSVQGTAVEPVVNDEIQDPELVDRDSVIDPQPSPEPKPIKKRGRKTKLATANEAATKLRESEERQDIRPSEREPQELEVDARKPVKKRGRSSKRAVPPPTAQSESGPTDHEEVQDVEMNTDNLPEVDVFKSAPPKAAKKRGRSSKHPELVSQLNEVVDLDDEAERKSCQAPSKTVTKRSRKATAPSGHDTAQPLETQPHIEEQQPKRIGRSRKTACEPANLDDAIFILPPAHVEPLGSEKVKRGGRPKKAISTVLEADEEAEVAEVADVAKIRSASKKSDAANAHVGDKELRDDMKPSKLGKRVVSKQVDRPEVTLQPSAKPNSLEDAVANGAAHPGKRGASKRAHKLVIREEVEHIDDEISAKSGRRRRAA